MRPHAMICVSSYRIVRVSPGFASAGTTTEYFPKCDSPLQAFTYMNTQATYREKERERMCVCERGCAVAHQYIYIYILCTHTHPLTGRPTHGQREKRGRQKVRIHLLATHELETPHTHAYEQCTNKPARFNPHYFSTRERIGRWRTHCRAFFPLNNSGHSNGKKKW